MEAVITVRFFNGEVAVRSFDKRKGRPRGRPFHSKQACLPAAVTLFVTLADFVADDAAGGRAAYGADGATAGGRGPNRAAHYRTADRTDRFTPAAAARNAEGRRERDTHND
jgi:hypothetical protein